MSMNYRVMYRVTTPTGEKIEDREERYSTYDEAAGNFHRLLRGVKTFTRQTIHENFHARLGFAHVAQLESLNCTVLGISKERL